MSGTALSERLKLASLAVSFHLVRNRVPAPTRSKVALDFHIPGLSLEFGKPVGEFTALGDAEMLDFLLRGLQVGQPEPR